MRVNVYVLNISDIWLLLIAFLLYSDFRLLISGGRVLPVPGGLSSCLSFWKLWLFEERFLLVANPYRCIIAPSYWRYVS